MQYKAVIFDFDLTLVDSSKGIIICFLHTLNEFGYPKPSEEEIVKTIGIPLMDGFDVLTGEFPNPHREEMRTVYIKKADFEMTKNTVLFPDTEKMLGFLKSKGICIGIVSSKMRYRIQESVDYLLEDKSVDVIIGLEDVREAKPSPEGLNEAIRRLGVEKSEVLYVGDSYIDAQTAENSNVDFCGVTTGTTSYEEFSKYKNIYIAKSLNDIIVRLENM